MADTEKKQETGLPVPSREEKQETAGSKRPDENLQERTKNLKGGRALLNEQRAQDLLRDQNPKNRSKWTSTSLGYYEINK